MPTQGMRERHERAHTSLSARRRLEVSTWSRIISRASRAMLGASRAFSRSQSCRCCHMAARRVLRAWRAFRGGTCVVGCSRWLSLGVRVSGRVRKRGGGSARFGRLRKSSPMSRVGASTWVGIGSRGAGWLGAAGL